MDKFKMEALNLRLDNLFNGRKSFDICAIREMGNMLGTNPEMHKDFETLSALHCIDYSKMSSELLAELPDRVMNVLSGRVNTGLMAKALAAVVNNEVNDMPSSEDDYPTRLLRIAK